MELKQMVVDALEYGESEFTDGDGVKRKYYGNPLLFSDCEKYLNYVFEMLSKSRRAIIMKYGQEWFDNRERVKGND